jgi:cbb3-type cytochrome oxidase maturation protein
LLIAVSFLAAFLIAVKKGQYKDTYTPSIRILFDDKEENVKSHSRTNGNPQSKI